MKRPDYQMSAYNDHDVEEILSLVKALWGNDTSSNRAYFTWKHRKNPFLRGDIGIVAKHLGRVIGFLGYVPAEYQASESRFSILQQCDTVIHPEHRGKGLFSTMSKMGIRMYGGEYKYIVNFTSNYITAGGLLKLGWQPLAPVRYLRRLSGLNLIKNRLSPARKAGLESGQFGNIEVSDNMHAADIVAAGITGCYAERKICLNKTPDFLEWRLSNPRARYLCLYQSGSNDIDAYLVVRIKNNHVHVFDYGQKPGGHGIQDLIAFMIKNAGFISISFFGTGTPDELKSFLRNNHFYNFAYIDRIRYGRSYNVPIIIRPTAEKYTEADWYIGGIDVRDINNWHVTEICFD